MKTVTVITPSVGTPYLSKCIASVAKQTVACEHWVVCDGPEYADKVKPQLLPSTKLVVLPCNTGHDKWNGHRIYAACSWLCDSKYVAFLDEDNYVSRNHFQTLVDVCDTYRLDWAYALRKIVNDKDKEICIDGCESLGYLASPYDRPGDRFIDTSCFLIQTHVARHISLSWNVQLTADRAITKQLLTNYPKHRCTKKYTVRYRMTGSNSSGITEQYFKVGNSKMASWIKNALTKPVLYVFHFDPEHTAQVLGESASRNTYAEYQMSNYADLQRHYCLMDGYRHHEQIKPGDTCLFQFVHVQYLPWPVLKRSDIIKILYTVESPNYRHAMQWDDPLLLHFTHILTFWTTLCQQIPYAKYAPMNTHFIDFEDAGCVASAIVDNETGNDERTVCMVLENRHLNDEYVVRHTLLKAQDYMRLELVKHLDDVVVYGKNWDCAADMLGPGVKIGHTLGKTDDTERSIDILKRYTFAVIVENCNASGYVSEKLYDCFAAGTIPIYYGNIVPETKISPDLYIDARNFSDSATLQTHLNTVDVKAMKARILAARHTILQSVSCQAFTSWIRETYGRPGLLCSWNCDG